MITRNSIEGSKALRIHAFASFFKRYMSVSTVVAASIPIPVTVWRLIPIYSAQKGFLTVYASLFCFLLLAFVFSIRHSLARQIFYRGRRAALISTLPFLFVLSTLGCVLGYHATLEQSIHQLRGLGITAVSMRTVLEKTEYDEIPRSLSLAAYYLGIFVFAEAAFVFMALREYLQDELQLDEQALLRAKE